MTRLTVGRLQVYLEPRDVWIGVYVGPDAVYVCPLPLLVFRWTRRRRWLADKVVDEFVSAIKTELPQPKPFDLSAIPVMTSDAVPDGQIYVFSPKTWIERAHHAHQPDVEGGAS